MDGWYVGIEFIFLASTFKKQVCQVRYPHGIPGIQVSRWRSRFLGRIPGRIPGFQVPFGISSESVLYSALCVLSTKYWLFFVLFIRSLLFIFGKFIRKKYFSILVCNYFLSSQIIEEEKAVSFTVLFILSKFNEMGPKTKLLRPTKTAKLSD